jgi:hypothetical protein
MRTRALFALASSLGLAQLGAVGGPSAQPWDLRPAPLTSPAGADSAQPQLSVSNRGVILSWIERKGPEASLKFSERRTSGEWSPAKTVASGTDWFVNWADVPSVIRLDEGTLVGHWLQKSGPDTYAYDVRLSYSRDDGKTWSASFTPHHDGTKTEHGFATLFQMPGKGLGLVWLDGRNMKAGDHGGGGHGAPGQDEMSLRFATFDSAWKQTADQPLDLRVCECCPTTVAMTADGPIVAYRDRSKDEVRDIHVTRLENGKWTDPAAVHADGWKIPACPVNGPALSARGRQVAIAWFHARDDQPRSFTALSSDAGRTFGTPVRLDDAASLGRVDVELLADGSAAAAYMEFADQKASFRVRIVARDGTKSDPVVVAGMVGNRSSGNPRMVLHGDQLVFAWTERDGRASRVQTAVATVRR